MIKYLFKWDLSRELTILTTGKRFLSQYSYLFNPQGVMHNKIERKDDRRYEIGHECRRYLCQHTSDHPQGEIKRTDKITSNSSNYGF